VTWVADYLHITHGEVAALDIIEDIDHQYIYCIEASHLLLIYDYVGFQLSLHFLGFDDSLTVETTISGQAMIRRH